MQQTDNQPYPGHLVEFGFKYWESQGYTEFNVKKMGDDWYRIQPIAQEVLQQSPPPPPSLEDSVPYRAIRDAAQKRYELLSSQMLRKQND